MYGITVNVIYMFLKIIFTYADCNLRAKTTVCHFFVLMVQTVI